ncbi:16S rRNA (uracil(1498)-N(3))-methyltransferase [Roseburia sp. BX1005]|uniref:Ribosomal RNA small subunit methyltransferase E n=1 Tax=Roseburia zhanii TaxID=2763064 RepID=A0A923LP77_9FIRM|nr:16S rRNA (uracil(1498)-N(3))-methyltransferase [Roseburia zhanii]MBC5714569.1 16S rRNA (uracil(1498)-N(3))-methyltransferase [Roseburia zhanii]
MYQFFVDDAQIGREFVTITGEDVNHIKNVLRMKAGEKIRISNQQGRDYYCEISEVTDTFVQADILNEDAASTELPSKIYLFQGIPKGDRMETVIEKAVELGVYEIIPVAMKYCVVKLDAKKEAAKVARWQKQAEAAAKQSKRSIIPKIHPVMSYKEAVEYAMQCDVRLVPYENERGMQGTREALSTIKSGTSVSVMIGPEGGFAEDEITQVKDSMQVISLGKRILRTDTAGIAVMSMLMLELEME